MDLTTALFRQYLDTIGSDGDDDDGISSNTICFEYIHVHDNNNISNINNISIASTNKNESEKEGDSGTTRTTTGCRYNTNDTVTVMHHRHQQHQQLKQRVYQLSYQDMIQTIYKQHVEYLLKLQHQLQLQQQQQQQRNSTLTRTLQVTTTTTIVLAYIANNSIDFLISILAAISSSSSFKATSSSSPSSFNHNDSNIISEKNNTNNVKLLPVLLSTKWTFQEIVNVLQIPMNNTNQYQMSTDHQPNEQQHSTTVILYDTCYQSLVQQVRQQLISQQQQQQHVVVCVPLPTFAHNHMMMQQQQNTRIPNAKGTVTSRPYNIKHRTDYTDITNDDAMIVFTSGTSSGISHGVRVSHRSIYVQCQMKQNTCFNNNNNKTRTRLLSTTVPIYHIGGICNYLSVFYVGGTLVMPLSIPSAPNDTTTVRSLLPSPPQSIPSSFDPKVIFQCLNQQQQQQLYEPVPANTLVVVPTMLHAMEQYYNKHHHDATMLNKKFPHVQCILIGGQSVSQQLIQNFLTVLFPNARLIQTYACTEATSSITYHTISNNMDTIASKTSLINKKIDTNMVDPALITIGQCVGQSPSTKIVEVYLLPMEEKNGEQQPKHHNFIKIQVPYQPGIIVTRGPHIMNGYWTLRGSGAKAKQNTTKDYLITNDVGYWDLNGYLYYVGRRNSDTIRTGGETVWCTEVEKIIQLHNNIIECTVFGIPDPYYGEVVCCTVVFQQTKDNNNNAVLSIHDIRSWCAEHGLAGYKRPRHMIVFTKSSNDDRSLSLLPRNSNGKILKYQLQQKIQELLVLKRKNSTETTSPTTTTFYIDNDLQLQSKL